MQKSIKIFALAVSSMMAVAVPSAANAETGYIRIGENCYIDIGTNYPFLLRIPCPREVSGE